MIIHQSADSYYGQPTDSLILGGSIMISFWKLHKGDVSAWRRFWELLEQRVERDEDVL